MRIMGRSNYFFDLATELYDVVNHDPLLKDLPALPACLHPSVRCVYRGAGLEVPDVNERKFSDSLGLVHPKITHDDLFVLGSTGGKDSLAVALLLLKEGMRGVAVHVRGINPAYPQEAATAREQARALKMEYREVRVRVNKAYIENPARNHSILLILAAYAHMLGASTVVEGLHKARVGETQPFKTGWSDCNEMAEAGVEMLSECAPWLYNRTERLPLSDTESIEYVYNHAPEMVPSIQSCMTTARHHARVRAISCKLAGYDLMPGRCGGCYKCCREWLVLRELGSDYALPSEMYQEHVVDRLVQSAPFCFGPTSASWSREEILKQFLARPSRT